MRKILKVVYTKNDGNLWKFINSAKLGIERKYPFAKIVETRLQDDFEKEETNILYILEV